jgi:hypothetical protein
MSKRKDPNFPPDIERLRYIRLAATPWHSLLLVAPALLLFQIGLMVANPAAIPLAPDHLGKVLEFFGAALPYLPPIAVVLVLLGQHFAHKDSWKVYPDVLACMGVEAVLWMLPLIALSELTGLLAAAGPETGPGMFDMLMVAVGAGVYEEFIFRLLALGLLGLLLIDWLNVPRKIAVPLAVVATAIGFSLYHPQNTLNGQFLWVPFMFRAMAGSYLAVIYLLRGFGITAWAHILFNVYVVLIQHHLWS